MNTHLEVVAVGVNLPPASFPDHLVKMTVVVQKMVWNTVVAVEIDYCCCAFWFNGSKPVHSLRQCASICAMTSCVGTHFYRLQKDAITLIAIHCMSTVLEIWTHV